MAKKKPDKNNRRIHGTYVRDSRRLLFHVSFLAMLDPKAKLLDGYFPQAPITVT